MPKQRCSASASWPNELAFSGGAAAACTRRRQLAPRVSLRPHPCPEKLPGHDRCSSRRRTNAIRCSLQPQNPRKGCAPLAGTWPVAQTDTRCSLLHDLVPELGAVPKALGPSVGSGSPVCRLGSFATVQKNCPQPHKTTCDAFSSGGSPAEEVQLSSTQEGQRCHTTQTLHGLSHSRWSPEQGAPETDLCTSSRTRLCALPE